MEEKKYEHVFFDLDRTLWDFESNSVEALSEIHKEYLGNGQFFSAEDGGVRRHRRGVPRRRLQACEPADAGASCNANTGCPGRSSTGRG